MKWYLKAGLVITSGAGLGIVIIWLTGCATPRAAYDCSDNHRPVAVIEVSR